MAHHEPFPIPHTVTTVHGTEACETETTDGHYPLTARCRRVGCRAGVVYRADAGLPWMHAPPGTAAAANLAALREHRLAEAAAARAAARQAADDLAAAGALIGKWREDSRALVRRAAGPMAGNAEALERRAEVLADCADALADVFPGATP